MLIHTSCFLTNISHYLILHIHTTTSSWIIFFVTGSLVVLCSKICKRMISATSRLGKAHELLQEPAKFKSIKLLLIFTPPKISECFKNVSFLVSVVCCNGVYKWFSINLTSLSIFLIFYLFLLFLDVVNHYAQSFRFGVVFLNQIYRTYYIWKMKFECQRSTCLITQKYLT